MRCPFRVLFITEMQAEEDCVYCNIGVCEDVEICPGNSDAWCTSMIEKQVKQPDPQSELLDEMAEFITECDYRSYDEFGYTIDETQAILTKYDKLKERNNGD